MITIKRRIFSAGDILSTNETTTGLFNNKRRYDQDMKRLGRLKTTRELHRVGDLGREIRKMKQTLNKGINGNL